MDSFEEALEQLAALVVKSRSKKLKIAFANYLRNFNLSMKNYLNFLSFMKQFEQGVFPQEVKWDNEFVVRHDRK